MLVPFDFLEELNYPIENWGSNWTYTFVQLHENAKITEVNDKISALRHSKIIELLQDSPEDLTRFQERARTEFMVAPLSDVHLHSYFGLCCFHS